MASSTRSRRRDNNPPQEEIVWSWKRKKAIKWHPKVNVYYKSACLSRIRERLREVGGQPLVQRFMDGCLGHFLRWSEGKGCGKVLHMVLAREIQLSGAPEYETWFRIGDRNMGFGPQEFCLVSGLRFGPSSFDPHADHDARNVVAFQYFCGTIPLSGENVLFHFTTDNGIPDPDGELHLKAANVLVMHYMGMGQDDRTIVAPWLWVLVDNLDAWNRFPLSSYSFKVLKNYIDSVNVNNTHYSLFGPAWVLQCWMVEAMPDLALQISRPVDSTALPRCLRTKMHSPHKMNLDHYFLDGVVCHERLVPEVEAEEGTDYWLSYRSHNDVIGVNYVKPVNKIKAGIPFERPGRTTRPTNYANESESYEEAKTYDFRDRPSRPPTAEEKGKRARTHGSSSTQERRFIEELSEVTRQKVKKDTMSMWKDVMFPDIKNFVKSLFGKGSRRSTPPQHTPQPNPSSPSPREHVRTEDDLIGNIPGRYSMPEYSTDWNPFSNVAASGSNIFDDTFQQTHNIHARHSVSDWNAHSTPPQQTHNIYGRHSVSDWNAHSTPLQDWTTFSNPHQDYGYAHNSSHQHSFEDLTNPPQILDANPISAIIPTNFDFSSTILHNPELYMQYSQIAQQWNDPVESSEIAKKNVRASKGKAPATEQEVGAFRPLRRSERSKNPGPTQTTPYVAVRPPTRRTREDEVESRYQDFLNESGDVGVVFMNMELCAPFFKEIEDYFKNLNDTAFDMYINILRRRVETKNNVLSSVNSQNTIILDTIFFNNLCVKWRQIHGANSGSRVTFYLKAKIQMSEDIKSWRNIIIPCLIGEHYIIVRVCLSLWIAEVYDSLSHVNDIQATRTEQLEPLCKGFWLVLECGGFYRKKGNKIPKYTTPLELEFLSKPKKNQPNRQFVQKDHHSYGPYALMTVERLISGSPTVAWGNMHGNVSDFRCQIARDIYHAATQEVIDY